MVCMLAADADTSMLAASTEGVAGLDRTGGADAGLPWKHSARLQMSFALQPFSAA